MMTVAREGRAFPNTTPHHPRRNTLYVLLVPGPEAEARNRAVPSPTPPLSLPTAFTFIFSPLLMLTLESSLVHILPRS